MQIVSKKLLTNIPKFLHLCNVHFVSPTFCLKYHKTLTVLHDGFFKDAAETLILKASTSKTITSLCCIHVGRHEGLSPWFSSSSTSRNPVILYPMFINITSRGSAFIRFWLAEAASSELFTSRSFLEPSWTQA